MNRSLRAALAIVTVAACGGDNVNHLADAPPNPDAPPDAPPTGPVTLTVTNQGQPAMGVQVYFQNVDQSLVAMPLTDANGDATATVGIGAFVTAIDPPPPVLPAFGVTVQSDTLHTWAGVKPGDHLHLDVNIILPFANVTVVAPTDPNATTYILHTSCGDDVNITPPAVGSAAVAVSNVPVPATLAVCSGTIDLIVETFDIESQPVSSFLVANQAITDGAAIDLSASTYAAEAQTTFNLSNINDANLSSIAITAGLVTGNGAAFRSQASAATVNGTTATTSIGVPTATGSVQVTESDIQPTNGVSLQRIFDWGAPTDTYNLDVDGALLHTYATLPSFDPATHSVTWTETAGVSADFVRAAYRSFRMDPILAHSWEWVIAAPRGTPAAVAYPVIPTTVFDFNTNATDTVNVDEVKNVKFPGGYDIARAVIMDVDVNRILGEVVVGAMGHAVVEDVAPPPLKRSQRVRQRRH